MSSSKIIEIHPAPSPPGELDKLKHLSMQISRVVIRDIRYWGLFSLLTKNTEDVQYLYRHGGRDREQRTEGETERKREREGETIKLAVYPCLCSYITRV